MTKRDLLILLLKVFGLYVAVDVVFTTLPSVLALGFAGAAEISDYSRAMWTVLLTFGLLWLLNVKTESIVNSLKMQQGFSDGRVDLTNIKPEDILRIGVIITGGLLVIRSIPMLSTQLYGWVQGEVAKKELASQDKIDFTMSSINFLVGLTLLTNRSAIARLLNRDREENEN